MVSFSSLLIFIIFSSFEVLSAVSKFSSLWGQFLLHVFILFFPMDSSYCRDFFFNVSFLLLLKSRYFTYIVATLDTISSFYGDCGFIYFLLN